MVVFLCYRDTLIEALSPLGKLNDGFYGGDAIYIWARLPPGACNEIRWTTLWGRRCRWLHDKGLDLP